jgi:hypothetical protein
MSVCGHGHGRNAPAKLGKAQDEDNGRQESILISGGGTNGTAKKLGEWTSNKGAHTGGRD